MQLAAFLVDSAVETLIQRSIQYGTVVVADEFCLELKVMVVRYLSACTHDGRGSRRYRFALARDSSSLVMQISLLL